MSLTPIAWDDTTAELLLLDQTQLPAVASYRRVGSTAELIRAMQELAVRGAPALGVAGAFGVVIALDEGARLGWSRDEIDQAIERVRQARPTAVNLAWAIQQLQALVPSGRAAVLAAARRLMADGEAANRELSRRGADWLLAHCARRPLRVLTHCNAGSLATSGWGTALGVIRELHARQAVELVYVDETRPLLQGSRLTAFELAHEGIAHLVQADSAAASTIMGGLVDCAVVGADRIAANGDTANKIGTLGVALACREAGVPLLVAAPCSTLDLSVADGAGIRIEQRDPDEVTVMAGTRLAPKTSQGFNPAFDVTPARLVSAIVTERGVAEPAEGDDVRAIAGC